MLGIYCERTPLTISPSNRPVHEGDFTRPNPLVLVRKGENNRNVPLRLELGRAALFIALLLVGDCSVGSDMRPLCQQYVY